MSFESFPPEVWIHVFSFLSKKDKHSVRSCCTYFKRLVDHPSLWKEDAVGLKNLSSYTLQFWELLRRRRISRVSVSDGSSEEWEQLGKWLPPSLTTISTVGSISW